MSVMSTNTTTLASLSQTLAATASTLWQRYTRYRMFRITLAEMQSMSPRELADFGVSRCEINRIAHECVYGQAPE